MAIPLKTGADLYNNELLRARLHNHPADALDEYGVGSFYFNNSSGLNSSDRMRYRGLTAWHSVANLEDINRLEKLISALSGSSSESVASVLGRVITLEGYFSNGKAKDADLLDGHNSDYFAEAATLNDLLEDYEAFKAVFSDNSDEYINTWTEVKDFLDGIKNTEDLNAILLGINTELGKKADKATTLAGYGITDALTINNNIDIANGKPYNVAGYGYSEYGWQSSGPALSFGTASGYLMQLQSSNANGHLYHKHVSANWEGDWHLLIDDHNYSDLITDLNNNLNVPSITIGGIKLSVVEGQLQIEGDAFATGQLSSGGIGSEGSGSGASGIVILEDWEKYDDTLAQVLGAGLGVGLRDKIAALESKATNVSVAQTLTSGKEIGAITIDGVATKLFAPNDYISTSGGTITTNSAWAFDIRRGTDTASYIHFSNIKEALGYLGISTDYTPRYMTASGASYKLLHEGNYATTLDNAYLRVDGGNVLKAPLVSTSTYLTLNGCSLYAKDGSTADWRVTTKDWTTEYRLLHSDNYESIVGNKFLKLTGGMINTGEISGLTIYRNNSKYSMIHFCNNEEGILVDVGYLGVVGEGVPVYLNSGGSQFNLLHAGNFNSYAPTLTGTGASGTWGIDITGSAAKLEGRSASQFVYNSLLAGRIDANATGGTTTAFYSEYRWDNTPVSTIGTLLETFYSAGWKSQLFIPIQRGENKIYFRHYSSTSTDSAWGDWKRLAFTDSNVASATKLQTARSLWGNSFDGTANINGDIHLAADKGIVASNGYAVLTAPSYLLLGYAQSELGQTTYLDGNDIYLRYGKNHVPAMYINSSGNVTIGASDLASVNHRLYVSGGLTRINSGLQVKGHTSFFAEANDAYVTSFYTDAKGLNIQPRQEDVGYTNIILAYSGGNVLIGTTENRGHKLTINSKSDTPLSSTTLHQSGLFVGLSDSRDSYGLNFWTEGNGKGFIQQGRTDEEQPALYDLILQPFGRNVGIGTANPAYKLDVNGDTHISGNLIVDGQVSSGGVATEGTGGATGGGGSGLERVTFTIPANTTSFSCEHNLGTREISVAIYEEGNDYQQVLTDVYLDSTNVARIVFGAATDVAHKVVIIG